MSAEFVDRAYVEAHPGVYFFVYSVPEVISANIRLDATLGSGSNIFHTSIVRSDGQGMVETITAGPAQPRPLIKQFGFTPVLPEIAFLSHPDPSKIRPNFDTVAWNDPGLKKLFGKTDWVAEDFAYAKTCVADNADRISAVRYNLGGHNSNSFAGFIWQEVMQHAALSRNARLFDPNALLAEHFRPGSQFDIFDRSIAYRLALIGNWANIAKVTVIALFHMTVGRVRRLLGRSSH